MTDSTRMSAGFYVIGDLCYIMHDEWDEVCDLTIKDDKVEQGFFEMKDGCRFGIWSTAFGDGLYYDNIGHSYPVDSGSIGIIAMKDVRDPELLNKSDLVNIITFKEDFDVKVENGIFEFGKVLYIDTRIETNYDEDDDYY